jgi:uncharacterized protein with beta-barrel porin domain
VISPEFHAIWRHEFLDRSMLVLSNFEGVSQADSFEIHGLDVDRDAAMLGGEWSIYLTNSTAITGRYDLVLSERQIGHVGRFNLQCVW